MNRVLILFALILGSGSVANLFAEDLPAPYSEQALQRQLGGLLFGSRENPALSITHDQAQKLLPLLNQWKANPKLNPADSKDIWTKAQSILTSDQKAFKPTKHPRPAGTQQNGSSEERTARALDRLISRLQKL